MKIDMKLAAWITPLVLVSAPMWAQSSGAPQSLKIARLSIGSDGASEAIVTPLDGNGKAIRGLSAANFQVSVNGTAVSPVTVSAAAPGVVPMTVVLAIDVSGSMRGAKLEGAIRGATAFVDQLGKEDRIALVTFGSTVRKVVDFTEDQNAIKSALNSLSAADRETHLYQAIFESVGWVESAPTRRTAIVLLTDGKDEGSVIGYEEVIAKITSRDVPLYLLGYGSDADARRLKRLALASHGEMYLAAGGANVSETYRDVAKELQTDYSLTWATPPDAVKPNAPVSVSLSYRGITLNASMAAPVAAGASGEAAPRQQPQRGDPARLLLLLGCAILVAAVLGFLIWRRAGSGPLKGEDAQTVILPRVWLEVIKGPDLGQRLLVFGKEVIIGRDSKVAQIPLRNDPMASRAHARLFVNEQGLYMVEDLGSASGTLVNGIHITEPITIQSADVLGIGSTELAFHDSRAGSL